MIIYYDNEPDPIFEDQFISSGAAFCRLYKGRKQLLMDRWTGRRIRPRSLIYRRPECAPEDDKLIVFDTMVLPEYLEWLCRLYPDKRILYWCWNPVTRPDRVRQFPARVELWTGSLSDSRKYGMRYNTPFFFDSAAQYLENHSSPAGQGNGIKALFFGRDKGRREKLLRLAGELETLGVGTEIHITKNRSTERSGNEDLMNYSRALAITAQADVLLDLSAAPGSGLSLRALEALYGGKKLITDNPEVLEYDFYACGNVYVPGRESRDLKTFLQTPPAQVPGRMKEYYLLSRWLKRFDE